MTVKSIWGAPGCGKTYYLRNEFIKCRLGDGVLPNGSVLLTTFRRNTADNIQTELAKMLNVDAKTLKGDVNTIHGVCYALLGGKQYKKVINQTAINKFNSETGLKFTIRDETRTEAAHGFIECYAWLKNHTLTLKECTRYPHFRSLKTQPRKVPLHLQTYETWKEDNGYLDFSDMLTDVLDAGLCPIVDTLLIDEFQDLTNLQLQIFDMWKPNIDNITIAGDPLQSVYGFMGGSPDHFNNMECEKIVLPKSHRLPSAIWECASGIAKTGKMQIPDIKTNGEVGTVKHVTHKAYMKHTGLAGTRDMTVYHLVRSRYQLSAIAYMLAKQGIIFDGDHGWSDNKIALFNAIVTVRKGEPLQRDRLSAIFKQYPLTYFNTDSKAHGKEDIKNMDNTQFETETSFIKPDLYDIIRSDNPMIAPRRKPPISAVMINNALKTYPDGINHQQLYTTLSTIHGVKGGERDRVFLHTGITPNIKKGMRRNYAEEARVFYVGVTRAHKELYIVKDAGQKFKVVF